MSLRGHIPELDGIRGVAIGMVLLAHYFMVFTRPGTPLSYLLVPLRLSWSGVDLFFVLSGFLIGGILLDARESSNYFRVFYARRFFRIVPIYVVLLISVALAIHLSRIRILGSYEEWFFGRLPWWYFFTFLQNIGMSLHKQWGSYPLAVTWSLAVEEQFYLTLPLLIRFLDRRLLFRFALLTIPSASLLRVFLFHRDPTNFFVWYTLMPCRADALLLGVVGALLLRDPRSRGWFLGNRRLVELVIAVLLLGVAYLGWRAPSYRDLVMVAVGFTWLALTYLSFLLYALLYRDSWVGRSLRLSWLRGLGAIAYGTYLFHTLIRGLFFGPEQFIRSWQDVGITLIVLVLMLSFCRLSWIYFEKPLVKIGHRMDYEFAPGGEADRKPAMAE
jgi:peptidoglycan/LPS O-acetylase OafA/YrhL